MPAPRIFGWQADQSGCGWYRIVMPLQEHARRGGDATWSEIMPAEMVATADVIIGQRVCKDGPTTLWQAMCKAGRALMVFEIDDDLWNVDPTNRAAHRFYKQPGIQANLTRNVQVADVVTVTTGQLAERIRPLNPNVVVVPNRIPAWLLHHQAPTPQGVTIGWAGSASHEMDWEMAGRQVGRFLNRNPHVQAHLIGGMFPSMTGWPRDRVRLTKWFKSVEDYYRALDFHIGLAPLRPHIFNQSKSALKALEMAALGIPLVASCTGPYETFVREGLTGYLVRRDHEWASYLRELANDQQRRFEMATNARRQAADNTVESNLRSWLDAWQVELPEMKEAA